MELLDKSTLDPESRMRDRPRRPWGQVLRFRILSLALAWHVPLSAGVVACLITTLLMIRLMASAGFQSVAVTAVLSAVPLVFAFAVLFSILFMHPGLQAFQMANSLQGAVLRSVLGVTRCLFSGLKRWIDERQTIVLFRSFHDEDSARVRSRIAPTLGSYGRLRYICDGSFDAAWAELAGYAFESTDDVAATMDNERSTDEDWRERVTDFLEEADLAVFDLASRSENIRWELEQALEHLGADRILVLHPSGSPLPAFPAGLEVVEYGHGWIDSVKLRVRLQSRMIQFWTYPRLVDLDWEG